MCEQCVAGTVALGEFAPGWLLTRATRDGRHMRAGQYALLRGDDPDFYLPDTPIAAPGRGVEEDTPEDDPIMAEWEEFDRACDSIVPALGADPATGWALVDACLRIPDEGRWSWDRDRKGLYYFEEWLCDRLGRMIAAQGQAR